MKKLLFAVMFLASFGAAATPAVFEDCQFLSGPGSLSSRLADYFDCVDNYVGEVEPVVSFNAFAGENPESMAIDSQGNLLISMGLTGEIRKVTPAGVQSTLAWLDVGPFDLFTFSGFMGAIAVDKHDVAFVALSSGTPANRGLWKILPNGTATLLAQFPLSSAPNGVAVKGQFVYVADATSGLIHRVPKSGGPAVVWLDDPLLKPIPGLPLPGPNGIQFHNGEFYISVSATGLILAVDASTKAVRVHAQLEHGCDDFAIDLSGNLYCTTDLYQELVRVNSDGTSDVLLTGADGLDGPTATVFGRRSVDEFFSLYITNAAFPIPAPPGFPPPPGNGSSVLKVELGHVGVPRFAF